jgi:hypothetical protein
MATAGKTEGQNIGQTQGGQNVQGSQGMSVGSPIANEAYNVIAALHSKLEGLEAYRKYAKDGPAQLWQNLTQAEVQGVRMLIDELERIVKDGRLRMKEPGRANA